MFERLFDNRSERSLATRMRRARFALFQARLARLTPPLRVLDVGGRANFWERMGFTGRPGVEVVLLNTEPVTVALPGFRAVQGDARDLSAFGTNAFDVIFSNSVIEHLGSLSGQQRMANEVRRVGRCYFVQTPNRYFPLEPHFLVPGFQFLPLAVQVALVRHFDLGWYQRCPDSGAALALVTEHRLLTQRELQTLFPAAEILHERVLGITKSLIACGGWPVQ
ncbi:MAG: methyltransferase domain-containing protein [Chloroflexales bacterium]